MAYIMEQSDTYYGQPEAEVIARRAAVSCTLALSLFSLQALSGCLYALWLLA
jgi:hypothetical protein